MALVGGERTLGDGTAWKALRLLGLCDLSIFALFLVTDVITCLFLCKLHYSPSAMEPSSELS